MAKFFQFISDNYIELSLLFATFLAPFAAYTQGQVNLSTATIFAFIQLFTSMRTWKADSWRARQAYRQEVAAAEAAEKAEAQARAAQENPPFQP